MPDEVMYILISVAAVVLCGVGSVCEVREYKKRAHAVEQKARQLQKRAKYAEDLNEVLLDQREGLRDALATAQAVNVSQRESIVQLRAERDALYKEAVLRCGPKNGDFM